MDYYDGNTVTGMWNYAQHYSMSDNSFGTTFGPSAPGRDQRRFGRHRQCRRGARGQQPVDLDARPPPNADLTADGNGGYSLTSDAQPYWDDCSTRDAVAMSGTNIGDELNPPGSPGAGSRAASVRATSYSDALAATGHTGQGTDTFIPDEFKERRFPATRCPTRATRALRRRPSDRRRARRHRPVRLQGRLHPPSRAVPVLRLDREPASPDDPHRRAAAMTRSPASSRSARHAVLRGRACRSSTPPTTTTTRATSISSWPPSRGRAARSALPAVSFLKAPGYEDGHARYSDPTDEQQFVADDQRPDEVAGLVEHRVIINYDDSDGWYDHVYSGVTNPSLVAGRQPDGHVTNHHRYPTSGKCGRLGPRRSPASRAAAASARGCRCS